MTESEIKAAIEKEFDDSAWCKVWRANVGQAKFDGRYVRFGRVGQADLTGIMLDGKRLEIEVKAARGRLDERQKEFGQTINNWQGIYIVARSVEDVFAALRARGYDLK